MKSHGFILMLLSGVLLLANPLRAESVSDTFNTNMNDASANQSWGEPEQNGDSESVWTWFGMGYELRNRGALPSSSEQSNA
ncbi:MAG: hypothetical protein HKP55_01060, partial [Gammaproteobacteria bacterium]|nr:hypothetical protein [Gammaproteobacteria bacterium]